MDLSKFLVPNLGLGGVVVLTVLLVLWGKLVPKATLDATRADMAQQTREWRDAYLQERNLREVKERQITTLLQMAQTTTAVLEALPVAANQATQEGASGEEILAP